jgi:hypothetical protein
MASRIRIHLTEKRVFEAFDIYDMDMDQFEDFLTKQSLSMEEALDRLNNDKILQKIFRDYMLLLDPDYDGIQFKDDELYELDSKFKDLKVFVAG